MVPHHLGKRAKQPGIVSRLIAKFADRRVTLLLIKRQAGEASTFREAIDVNALQGDTGHRPVRELAVDESVAALKRERIIAAVGTAAVGLDRDSDRHRSVDIVV